MAESSASNVLQNVRIGTLVFGIFFVILGVAGLLGSDIDPAWIWVSLFAATGIGGLAATFRTVMRARQDGPNTV